MCDQLAMNLGREYRAAAIHGDKKQQERDAVLAGFKVRVQGSSVGYWVNRVLGRGGMWWWVDLEGLVEKAGLG